MPDWLGVKEYQTVLATTLQGCGSPVS